MGTVTIGLRLHEGKRALQPLYRQTGGLVSLLHMDHRCLVTGVLGVLAPPAVMGTTWASAWRKPERR